MSPLENLYYAIGELAYAMAGADGKIQNEEKKKFREIVAAGLKTDHREIDVADVIFQLLEKRHQRTETAYDWAMNTIRQNSHYLSPVLKSNFISFLEKIAQAYPPVSKEEREMLTRFKADIEPLNGDPVYYQQ